MTNSNLHIKAQQDSGWINTKRSSPRYIIVKMWKADNFLKASRNNNLIQVLVSFTSELSSKTLEARGGGKAHPKGWKETGAHPKPGISEHSEWKEGQRRYKLTKILQNSLLTDCPYKKYLKFFKQKGNNSKQSFESHDQSKKLCTQ